jgi:hypothetical protein
MINTISNPAHGGAVRQLSGNKLHFPTVAPVEA